MSESYHLLGLEGPYVTSNRVTKLTTRANSRTETNLEKNVS